MNHTCLLQVLYNSWLLGCELTCVLDYKHMYYNCLLLLEPLLTIASFATIGPDSVSIPATIVHLLVLAIQIVVVNFLQLFATNTLDTELAIIQPTPQHLSLANELCWAILLAPRWVCRCASSCWIFGMW